MPDKTAAAFLPDALASLAAIGEETRLRVYALLTEAELAVSELVAILGQSQPRVSRHLRLLLEAGLLDRHREGAWAFFHASEKGPGAALARAVLARLDSADPVLARDRARLEDVRASRAGQAQKYFAEHAPVWNETRKLHAPEAEVEAASLRRGAGKGIAVAPPARHRLRGWTDSRVAFPSRRKRHWRRSFVGHAGRGAGAA